MKLKALSFFLLLTATAFGQTSKFSIEAAYPIPVDNNFLGKNYQGIADLGLKYKIKNLEVINIGVSVNGSVFTYNDTKFFPPADESLSFKTTLYMIQPRAFAELNLKKVTKIHPMVGIGYTILQAKTSFDSQTEISDFNSSQSGLNFTIGLSYDVFTKFYVFGNYEYISLSNVDANVPKTTYNTKINLVKLGLGLRF